MEIQPPTEGKKSFLQNDRLVVCSMLVIYGVCILGAIGALFWGLNRVNQKVSADATSTTVAVSTKNAYATTTAMAASTQNTQATRTAVAHGIEIGGYVDIDNFNSNINQWMVGPQNDEYWVGDISIENGVYLWDIKETKKSFIHWANYKRGKSVRDFDAYVKSKIIEDGNGIVCTGLIFRKSSKGWDYGGYAFNVCNNSHFRFSYHGKDGWQTISKSQYSSAIQPTDWNLIEVSARGNQYTFTINNVIVYEITDNHRSIGDISLFVELNDEKPAKIVFDSFGLQRR